MTTLASRVLGREMATFLTVGGAGYVVDVAVFNVLRSIHPWSTMDPSVARTFAVMAAMVVTYLGNRELTWRNEGAGSRRREVTLFVLFNVIGFGFSVVTLAISHDVLGLTSRLADNVSANVVGVALGTVFRYLTYKHAVFGAAPTVGGPVASADRGGGQVDPEEGGPGRPVDQADLAPEVPGCLAREPQA